MQVQRPNLEEIDPDDCRRAAITRKIPRKDKERVTTGRVAHVEMDDKNGLMRVFTVDHERPGGGVVHGSVTAVNFLSDS